MGQIAAIRREQKRSIELFEDTDSLGLFHSAIAARIVQGMLDGCYERYSVADRDYQILLESPTARTYCIGPVFESADESAIELSARVWAQSSLDMHAICRRRGVRYLHVLQPTLHDEGSKPVTDEERAKGAEPADWALGAKLGYPKLRAHAAELAAAGVEFLDASRAFAEVTTSLYYDVCHFAPEGNRKLAELVLEVIRREPPENPPPPAPPPKDGKKRKPRSSSR
jgi:hypothetical protein